MSVGQRNPLLATGECRGAKNQGAYGGNGSDDLRQGNCQAHDGVRVRRGIERDSVIAGIDVERSTPSSRRPRPPGNRCHNLRSLAVVFHRFRIVAGVRHRWRCELPELQMFRRRYASKNPAGTRNTVRTTESNKPPINARANGAYDSLPSPNFSAMGKRLDDRR